MKIPTFKQGDPSQFTIQISGTIFPDLLLENNPCSSFLKPKESLKTGAVSIGQDNITILDRVRIKVRVRVRLG